MNGCGKIYRYNESTEKKISNKKDTLTVVSIVIFEFIMLLDEICRNTGCRFTIRFITPNHRCAGQVGYCGDIDP